MPKNTVNIVDDNLRKPYGEPYSGKTQVTPIYKQKDIKPVATMTKTGPNSSINVRKPTSNNILTALKYFCVGVLGATICMHVCV